MGPFDESVEQWSSYTERFEYFVLANSIKSEVMVPTFLTVMGGKTFNLLRSLVTPEKPGDRSYEEIVGTLKAHYSPKPLIIAERFRFHKRNQEEGESISQFVAVLKQLSEHCEFGHSLNDTIRDRLVCGMRSGTIQKRLLTEANLTLQKALEVSLSMEMANKDAQQLSTLTLVHKVSTNVRSKTVGGKPCYRCGRTGHHPEECWCKDLDCRSCGKKGHIERVCKNKEGPSSKNTEQRKSDFKKYKNKVHKLERTEEEQSDTPSEGEESLHVLSLSDDGQGYWVTPLLDGKAVRMQVDTGAAVSLVSEGVYRKKLHHLKPQPAKITLKTYTGEAVPVSGIVTVTVKLNKQKVKLPLYIVKGSQPALLGRTWLEKIKLNWQEINMVAKVGDINLQGILRKHAAVFKDELGRMKDITVKLTVKPNSKPKCFKARSVPYAIKPKVEAELDKLVKSGVLD
uniref:CCHC-type domain-containing protein n=1 Tax=Gasterosteus aculeatus aculeatus TaxID=481459 RepID=A0AAQ4QCI8_GASAC